MLMHRPQTPQPGFGSITLLQKFTPHFKILDARLLPTPPPPNGAGICIDIIITLSL